MIANPVDPVVIEEEVTVGYVVPETVTITPIPDTPEFGYIYVDDRPMVVDLNSRKVVYIQG